MLNSACRDHDRPVRRILRSGRGRRRHVRDNVAGVGRAVAGLDTEGRIMPSPHTPAARRRDFAVAIRIAVVSTASYPHSPGPVFSKPCGQDTATARLCLGQSRTQSRPERRFIPISSEGGWSSSTTILRIEYRTVRLLKPFTDILVLLFENAGHVGARPVFRRLGLLHPLALGQFLRKRGIAGRLGSQ